MQPVRGIHHITAFASNPQANVDFYRDVLGQRLVKTTVNFDDPGTYHLYYGDEVGSPGTILTFFPWVGARRGQRGRGEIGAVAYAIRRDSLEFWRARLAACGVTAHDGGERFGAPLLSFEDPDGMPLELIASDPPDTIRVWRAGPIPPEHALRGLHGLTVWAARPEPSVEVLTGIMGYRLAGRQDNRWQYVSAGAPGPHVDLLIMPELARGLMGAGSVHHVAFRARDDVEQLEYQQRIGQGGLRVTEVKDRQYFHSIYFREPGGVLFEIATDGPGFLIDEPIEQLGTSLKLPPWLEPQRDTLVRVLPSFTQVSHV